MVTHEELRVETADGAVLAGTLTLPASPSPCPAFVGVHGASLGTRDAELYRHLQVLLGGRGIARHSRQTGGTGASVDRSRWSTSRSSRPGWNGNSGLSTTSRR